MHSLAGRLLLRWFVSSLGLWLSAALLSSHISYGNSLAVIVAAGFVLALLNMVIKPILFILSLPAVILSLGLFMFIINGAVVYLTSVFYPPLHITGFWAAVVAGIIVGLVNYLVTAILEKSHDSL